MKKLKDVFQKFLNPTLICKNCFKEINEFNLYNLLHKNSVLCKKCLSLMHPKFIKFKIDNIKALTLFEYDVYMKDLIYKLKGCYDYELKDVFIGRFRFFLKIRFNDYTILHVPSYIKDDEDRGFNHVREMFSCLGLDSIDLIEKTTKYKQSDHSGKDRENIKDVLRLKNNQDLSQKKILIVDDVFTTGSTIKNIIKMISPLYPKDIKVLVMSKTIHFDVGYEGDTIYNIFNGDLIECYSYQQGLDIVTQIEAWDTALTFERKNREISLKENQLNKIDSRSRKVIEAEKNAEESRKQQLTEYLRFFRKRCSYEQSL